MRCSAISSSSLVSLSFVMSAHDMRSDKGVSERIPRPIYPQHFPLALTSASQKFLINFFSYRSMQVLYEKITIIRKKRVLVYCPHHSKKSRPWIHQIQTRRIVERWYNLDYLKSCVFTQVVSDC